MIHSFIHRLQAHAWANKYWIAALVAIAIIGIVATILILIGKASDRYRQMF